MLDYEVHVVGAEKEGHPITFIISHLKSASELYDELVKKYPYNKVVMSLTTKKVLNFSTPQKRPAPACPFNHTGKQINGQPVIAMGIHGKYYCAICAWKES